MIAPVPRRHRCIQCGRPTSRSVVVDNRAVAMCGRCPSPSEILERAAQLRETWPAWRWKRARRCEMRGVVRFDEVVHQRAGDRPDQGD